MHNIIEWDGASFYYSAEIVSHSITTTSVTVEFESHDEGSPVKGSCCIDRKLDCNGKHVGTGTWNDIPCTVVGTLNIVEQGVLFEGIWTEESTHYTMDFDILNGEKHE